MIAPAEPIFVAIKVITRSSRAAVGELGSDQVLKVYVTMVPEKGKANQVVIKLLAKHWGISPSQIHIARGATSSTKLLRVEGVSKPLFPSHCERSEAIQSNT